MERKGGIEARRGILCWIHGSVGLKPWQGHSHVHQYIQLLAVTLIPHKCQPESASAGKYLSAVGLFLLGTQYGHQGYKKS